MKKVLLFSFVFIQFDIVTAQLNDLYSSKKHDYSNFDKQFFIENKGQWTKEVLYLSQLSGLNIWITRDGMLYEFYKADEIEANLQIQPMPNKFERKEFKRYGDRVAYKLIGNNDNTETQGKNKMQWYYNYLVGNDISKHARNVGLYKEVLIKEVYSGIDLRYYFDKGLVRYDYIVKSGADPSQIIFKIEGSKKTFLNEKQELVFKTNFGEIKNSELYGYLEQDKKPVYVKFRNQGDNWTFAIGDYNKKQTLIIDPLIYSTFLGGGNDDTGFSITLDALGNAFVTGCTESNNFDITTGAFQSNYHGNKDIFVSKFNATGTALIYSTFIGGSNDDISYSIAADALGNSYITGTTRSANFNITAGVFQTIYGGISDVFVVKLNSTGTALIYSTFIGGYNLDQANSIAIDASGNAFITGYTVSFDFDITSGVFQTNYEGNYDVFVTLLNSSGTALLYSTFIGGTGSEQATSISIDASNNAYITGWTLSTNFDITSGAYQTNNGGTYDIFVTKINSAGTNLIYSTYIGGIYSDVGNSIALDNSGNTYVTGCTYSPDFDITSGVFQSIKSGNSNVFVTKLNSYGSALIYSTYMVGVMMMLDILLPLMPLIMHILQDKQVL